MLLDYWAYLSVAKYGLSPFSTGCENVDAIFDRKRYAGFCISIGILKIFVTGVDPFGFGHEFRPFENGGL